MNPPQGPNQRNEFSVSFNAKADAALGRIQADQQLDGIGALKRCMQIVEALAHDDARGNLLRAEKNGLYLDTWEQKTILEIFLAESELGADNKTMRTFKTAFPPQTLTRLNDLSTNMNIADRSELIARAVVFVGRLYELKARGWKIFIEYPGSGTAPALEVV